MIIFGIIVSFVIGFVIGINKGSRASIDSDTIGRMSSR